MNEPALHTARLRWRCRRGMKELDALLNQFLERHYAKADIQQQQAFARLLELQDPEIYGMILGHIAPTDEDVADVIRRVYQATDP